MWEVQLFELNYDSRETSAVSDIVNSRWITMGEETKRFEEIFSEFLGGNTSCIALSSGTAALHIALLSLDIASEDEVFIPALTFVADLNVVKIAGATPVLADCGSYDNWNITAATIEKCITDKTKAVIIVHFAGYPCQMDEIVALCKKKNLKLIEDVAHAPGAQYKGQACGTFGDISCFSFFTNKNLSIGEGGMLVTNSKELEQKAKYYRSHGMTSLTLDRHKGRAISYDVVQPGLNYRIDEMRSAIGIVQLEKLIESNQKRKAIVKRYLKRLNMIDNLHIPFSKSDIHEPAYHIFPILLDRDPDRTNVIEAMKKDGVQTSIHYPSFKNFAAYEGTFPKSTPIADDISERELTLPLFPTMTFDQLDYVTNSLKKALKN